MAKELSAKEVESAQLPTSKSECELYDGENLILRLKAGRSQTNKSWMLRYMLDGKRRKVGLGSYPEVTLAEARKKALELLTQIQGGIDPLAEKAKAKAKALADEVATTHGATPTTIRELFDRWNHEYLERHHSDKGKYVREQFERHVLQEKFASLELALTSKVHVRALMETIHSKGLTRTCGVILSSLRQIFDFAIESEWMSLNPTGKLKADAWKGNGEDRSRTLSRAEIKELHKILHKSKLAARWKHTIWFVMAMGTRIEETLLAETTHFDLLQGTWLIPKENQKKVNNIKMEDRTLHISDFAKPHLTKLIELAKNGRYLFPGRATAKVRPVDAKTFTKLIRDRQRGEGEIDESSKGTAAISKDPNQRHKQEKGHIKGRTKSTTELLLADGSWTPHDLRRTMSTMMQELDIPPDIIDKCQGHSPQGKVQRTYQRAELTKQQASAWQKWGELLAEIIKEADEELNAPVKNPA